MVSLLFIGNSYTFYNELNGMVDALLEEGAAAEGDPAWADVETTRLAGGGYTFEMHVDKVGVDPAWTDALTGGTAWRYGILQEQSQIPGFYGEDPIWESSAAAAVQLDDWLEAGGAGTFLLMTWGRRDGDSQNTWLYPDFPTMQAELTEGYTMYRDRLSTEARPVWIIPAGPAFAAIYDEALAAGEIPQQGLFGRLYDGDGSHPSLIGSYLIACVSYAALTGHDPVGLSAPQGLDPADVQIVQQTATEVVIDGDWPMPWRAPEDTGDPGDSGGDDSGSGDDSATGDAGTADSGSNDSTLGDAGGVDSGPPVKPAGGAPAGCGCSGGGALAWLALLPLPLWSRRRAGGRRA